MFVLIITLFIGAISVVQVVMGTKYDHTSDVSINMGPLFNGTKFDVSWHNFDFKYTLPFNFGL
jgi:hypothetical protein